MSVPSITPSQDFELQVTRYAYVATVTAFVYDILLAIDEEAALLSRRVNLSTAVYWVSKLGAGGFIVTTMVLLVYPVGTSEQCQAVQQALGWSYVVAAPSIALLFFFRVAAVFQSYRIVVGFFAFLWIAVLGAALTVPFSVTVAEIGNTKRCIDISVAQFSSSTVIVNWINDSLVFLAISWRLMGTMLVAEQSRWKRLKSFVRGDGFSRLSKALLQGGQLYYLATVGFSIVTIIALLAPIPAVYHALFTVPNLALQNAMACRVYRQLKLGIIRDMNGDFTSYTTSRPLTSIVTFGRLGAKRQREEWSYPLETFDRIRSPSMQVHVSQEQEVV